MERMEEPIIVRTDSASEPQAPFDAAPPIVRRSDFAEPAITAHDVVASLRDMTEASRTPEAVLEARLRSMARLLFTPNGGIVESPLQESMSTRW